MGKNTSFVLNQNSNNLWLSVNSNNSDWIRNEDKNINNQNFNKSNNSNTSNNLNNNNNNNINSIPLNHSQINISNFQQLKQSKNKTNNMNPSLLENFYNINNKINIMDMSNNNPNPNPSDNPKLFSNKEDNNNYYLNTLNSNVSLSDFLNGNDSAFLNKKEVFEDTIDVQKQLSSNKDYCLTNMNNNFNNTSIEEDINSINNDFFAINNNESAYNQKNNSEILNRESNPSRIILISEIPEYFNFNQIINENLSKYGEIRQVFFTKKKGILIIYWDIKSAIDAYNGIHRELSYGNIFSTYFIDPSDLQNYVPIESIENIMDNQGLLYIVLNQSLYKNNMKLLLSTYGKIRKFYQSKKNVFVEYDDVRSTEKALNSLQEFILKGKLLYVGYSKPGNWLLNNIKDNNEFIRYTSNNNNNDDFIKQNTNYVNKEQTNTTNYLNNFNDLTFMNNNWYSPYKTDLFINNANSNDNKFNKENGVLVTNDVMSIMTSNSKIDFPSPQYFNKSIRNNNVLLSPSSEKPNVDSTNYQCNSEILKDDIDNISEQLKNLSNITTTTKADISSNNNNNNTDFGIIGDQRHNQNIYNDNMFMFNQMKPILNNYPIVNKILSQPMNTNRIGSGTFTRNISNFNMNTNPIINNVNVNSVSSVNINNMNNMNNLNHMNNINNMNNINTVNSINIGNINNINNMGNMNNYSINMQQNQDLMMPYNNTNISSNTAINSKSSFLFNSDSHTPTNNSSNNILRINNATPSNSNIATTSSLETQLSDIGNILSSNNLNSSKIIPVTSNNYINLPNTSLNNYNSAITMTTNKSGSVNNVTSHPLKLIKSNSPMLQNKNNLSCNTPVLSTIQTLNDKSNNNNLNGIKIKNKSSLGGIPINKNNNPNDSNDDKNNIDVNNDKNINNNNINKNSNNNNSNINVNKSKSNNNSLQMTSNEYSDTYHRRITMEERRMCQSTEDSNRKNNKNGNNNMNLNERQMNQNSNSKRHVIPRGNELILSKVISGLDERTTFMIRNIPNKYTQQMLIDTINDTHFGQFDFLYLRMDFKNRCNVGYAFINFVDIKAVISFAEKVVGKKWTRFNSDKICTLSYANIQGRDSLIEKFKNSSVMLEDPSYRPKIFYTSGELKGQEEPFPPPTIPLQFKPYSSVLLNSNLQKSTVYNNKIQNHNDKTNDNNTK